MVGFKSIDLRIDHGITLGDILPDSAPDLGSQAVGSLAAIVTEDATRRLAGNAF